MRHSSHSGSVSVTTLGDTGGASQQSQWLCQCHYTCETLVVHSQQSQWLCQCHYTWRHWWCVMSSHSGSVSVTTLGDTGGAVTAVTVALSVSLHLETLVVLSQQSQWLCQCHYTWRHWWCVMSSHSGSVSVTTLGDTGGAVTAVTVALSVSLTEPLATLVCVIAVTVLCQVSVTLVRATGDCCHSSHQCSVSVSDTDRHW